ncbi:MAG: 3-hydroxyacyl-CoA dehydrogenase NAD-binding domain-containing protein [Pusillimonas sp.]
MEQEQWLGAPSAIRAVVVGGGIMGTDVAVVLLRAHCPTVVVEPRLALHDGIREKIAGNLQAIDRGENIGLLGLAASIDDVDWREVRLMIECVPESLDIKRDLFSLLADRAPAHTLLASNSSSFPISQIAQGLPTQERMIGLHFFMPAHIVPLAEVVLGPATDTNAADALAAFMRRCGSVPILVRKDVPGFIGNRLQHALGREAFSLIQEGIATPEDIDAAVRFGFGFRYLAAGPIMQKEHAGLDVHAAAAATIYPSLSNVAVPPPVLSDKPRNGQLGMKSGQGFYAWGEQNIAAERERYTRALQASLRILAEELPPIQP